MPTSNSLAFDGFATNFKAGIVVFFVALPLCVGVAITSGVPLISGLIAGVVGGILVGLLSGSQCSVSGPAAGLTAIVVVQLQILGSFPALLLAVVLAGMIQVGFGLARVGVVASFFPSSVIRGLIAAIGLVLILKQIPHVLGHDPDPEGDLAFLQPDRENTFSELIATFSDIHPGAASIGVVSLAILFLWGRSSALRNSGIPAALVVVPFGVIIAMLFRQVGGNWVIGPDHLVQLPTAERVADLFTILQSPDFSQWSKPAIFTAAITIALAASLETLLTIEAIDKLDPQQRSTPVNRELMAQGVGNIAVGFLGGLPIASVVVRSTVLMQSGARSKAATIIHGVLLLIGITLLPVWLNHIPLSCLAAILFFTGVKLVSPDLIRRMWQGGVSQFVPFAVTIAAMIFTDLLVGIGIGLIASVVFILRSNVRRPLRRYVEQHLGSDVLHIELANQVSFLNRSSLARVLDGVPNGGHVLLDARNTDYFDPDVLELIREYSEFSAPARGIEVSLVGFRSKYLLEDRIQYVDYSTRDLQESITPDQVLKILKDGHERFRTGQRLTRDFSRAVSATAAGQHPLAVVLSCIDSRTPAEILFDLGVGDIFGIRIAGNIISRKILASAEYGCAVAGAKLILVMGHTRCGAVTAAVKLSNQTKSAAEATGCQHLDHIITDIQRSIAGVKCDQYDSLTDVERETMVDAVARQNVREVVQGIRTQSRTLDQLARDGKITIVGAMYDVGTGEIEFMNGATHAL